ncbi:MAG: class I SAM-dependent methyltransferase [Dehalococcoidia bacterium]
MLTTDLSDGFLERARERTVEHSDRIEYRTLDATAPAALDELGAARFDAVVATMVLMDMPVIAPLFAALPRRLRFGGRFVFAVMHPCFNSSGAAMLIEEDWNEDGMLSTRYAMKVSRYLRLRPGKGTGMAGARRAVPVGGCMMRPLIIARTAGVMLLPLLVVAALTHASGAIAGGRDAATLAEAAAMAALNGVPASACTASGQLPPPGRDTCITISPMQVAQADRGLVALQAFLSPDVQPLFVVVGRGIDGDWGLWLAAPAAYVPVQLPGDARLCGASGVPVRSEPSVDAPVRASLPHESVVTVDRFVLERPGTWQRSEGGTPGGGWYHFAAPVDGWVAADAAVIADADCAMALH